MHNACMHAWVEYQISAHIATLEYFHRLLVLGPQGVGHGGLCTKGMKSHHQLSPRAYQATLRQLAPTLDKYYNSSPISI